MLIHLLIPTALVALAAISTCLIWGRLRGDRPDRIRPMAPSEPAVRVLPRRSAHAYRAKPLLTDWERRALLSIRARLPQGYYVCPQVRLADLLHIDAATALHHRRALITVAAKSVDFAIIELSTGRVALAVELDDRSHDLPERMNRDRVVADVLAEAGVPLARFRSTEAIDIRPYLGAAAEPSGPPRAGDDKDRAQE